MRYNCRENHTTMHDNPLFPENISEQDYQWENEQRAGSRMRTGLVAV